MKLFRQAYEQDNGLPVGFTEVEYLESTGTQWIDLGLKGKDGYDFDYKFNSTRIDGTAYGIGGEWESDKSCYLGLIRNTNKFAYHYDGTKSPVEVQTLTANTDYRVQAHLYSGEQYYILNGTKSTVGKLSGNFTSSANMWLFGIYSSTPLYSYVKIYYLKIYDGDTLVRDFIPCIDPLGVPCMYDLVSKKAYYNQGTGENFLYGRHIIPVEYLESKGTPYIDTGLRLTQNNAIEVCYKINSISGFSGIVGARTSASSNNISVNANTGGVNSPFISIDFNNSNFETYRARYDDRTNDKILVYLDKHIRKININNSVVVSNNTECNDTIKTQSNCLLFRAPGINSYCDLNMYYCKIYDNDILVRDYIPAIDENNVGYMFDRVTHTAYLNAGSGNFTYGENATKYKTRLGFVRQMGGALRRLPKGFTEVEYLESTGTQYINTGYIPTNSTGYKLKHTICEDNSTDNLIVGCREDSGDTRFWEDIDWGSSDTIGWGYGTYSNNDLSYRWSLVGKAGNVVESGCNYYNSRNCFVNDEIKQLPQPELPKITRPMYLFCANFAGSAGYFIKSKIYYAKITEGSELVRYFIPCIDPLGVPCMYDKVEGKAYYNKGTGSFLYGEKKPARYLLATPKVRLEVPAIYKRLDYIESTGTQYIDTGYAFTDDFSWEIDFDGIKRDSTLFGGRTSSTRTAVLYQKTEAQGGETTCPIADKWGSVTPFQLVDLSTGRHKVKMSVASNKGSAWVDDIQVYDEQSFTGEYITGITQVVFANNYGTSVTEYTLSKVYALKMWQGTTLVRNFIPCLDSSNIPCMYDKVEGKAYYNKGTGSFLYGYKKK